MKNVFSLLIVLAISIFSLQAQDLQEILDSHFEVIGQEANNNITTMKATGKSVGQGMENEFTVYQMRPKSFRLEVNIQGTQMIQSFDGEKGWYVAPWTGSTDPIEMAGEQLRSFARQADFDGTLFNYEEKGYQTELIGIEEMEGTEVFKIKQTDKEGDIFYQFIDTENFILLKTTAILKMGESETKSETYYSNFNEQEGIVIPFNIDVKMNDQTVSQIKIEHIEFNLDIDKTIFTMPPKEEQTEEKPEEEKE
ncbi:MAG: outer membrane lipoprotein-sorting protein [Bacteroidales bacterium]|nr:outer membrane lipoprotein-sorting protein [Bacteroidales bacterium]